jgi:hypothetical protein
MSLQLTESPDMRESRNKPVKPDDARQRRRRARSLAIAFILLALVVLFYLVTIAKLGPGVLDRPI